MSETAQKPDGSSERLSFGVTEAAAALGVSPGFVRAEMSSGNLRAVRLGRRVVVTRSELERYLATAPARTTGDAR
jgi:excisionase family DNA binding protein